MGFSTLTIFKNLLSVREHKQAFWISFINVNVEEVLIIIKT